LAFVIVRIAQGRAKDVHWVMWVAAALFLLRIVTLVI
jgi:AGZA family xanthine/uracil permease-like MFS transporter